MSREVIPLDDTDKALIQLLFTQIEANEKRAIQIRSQIQNNQEQIEHIQQKSVQLEFSFQQTQGGISALKTIVNQHAAQFAEKYSIPGEKGRHWTVNAEGIIVVEKEEAEAAGS